MDGLALTVRPATSADTDRVLDLVHAAYRGGPGEAGWTTEAHLLDGLRADPGMFLDMIDRPGGQVLLFFQNGDPRHDPHQNDPPQHEHPPHGGPEGDLLACCQLEQDGDTGYFGLFAVRPRQQGGGIGSAVLAEAERRAAAQGCRQMRMTVLSVREDLIGYYERRGYRRTGATEPFPYGDERFGTPKRQDLRFAELRKPLLSPTASPDDPGPARGSPG